jgi:hypothetical protein
MPYSIRFKMIETNWKWQASEGEDNSCITSTWSYQWSEATRLCFNHEGHINPSVHLVQIKSKRKGNARSASTFFILIFQFTSHKHTPGEFNHTLAKIQLCVMTSSAINWAVALFSYKLILLNRHANTSQEERLGPSHFHPLIIYVYIKVKWATLSFF